MTYAHHSTPHEADTGTEPAAAELAALARQIEDWREGRGLSIRQLCGQISGLNSKTFSTILAGDLTELRPENHIAKYRAALAETAVFDLRQEAEPVIPGLEPTAIVAKAIASLKLKSGPDRFVLIEGESGAGKTTALKHAATTEADHILLSAHEGWGRPSHALKELLEATGFRGKLPEGFSARLEKLKQVLKDKPKLILIDEGHHMESRMLNVLKDLINSTKCWVVVATMASLWRKIQANKWSEVKQLIHNRMHIRVVLPVPGAAGAESYLVTRLGLEGLPESGPVAEQWNRAFAGVASDARSHGLYAYCRKVAAAARLVMIKDDAKAITPAHIFTAAAMVSANTAGFDR